AAEIIRRTGAVLVHPYNDARIIAGQATAAMELLEDMPDLDFILAPVSGGGLLSGSAIAAKSLRPAIRVIGCEPKNADDAFRSLAAGRIETRSLPSTSAGALDQPDTIADGLRASLCARTLAFLQCLVERLALVHKVIIIATSRHVSGRIEA